MNRPGRAKERTTEKKRPPKHVFGVWPEIRSRIRASGQCAIFLDFDGTLVEVKRRPHEVRVSARVVRVLRDLARRPNVHVAIVSGRRLSSVRRLLDVAGVHYFGLHGGEMDGESVPIARSTRAALDLARRKARRELASLPGIWVEDKGLTFSIHHRTAGATAVRAANLIVPRLVAPSRGALHVLNGRRVWEILPREIPGKYAAVQRMLAHLSKGIHVIYIGDDDTDEPAFAVLAKQTTVRVRPRGMTQAQYSLRNPSEVVKFLERIEGELC